MTILLPDWFLCGGDDSLKPIKTHQWPSPSSWAFRDEEPWRHGHQDQECKKQHPGLPDKPKRVESNSTPKLHVCRLYFVPVSRRTNKLLFLRIVLYCTGHVIVHLCVLNDTLEVKKRGAVKSEAVVRLVLVLRCDLGKETTEMHGRTGLGATGWIEVQACSCMPYEEQNGEMVFCSSSTSASPYGLILRSSK